MADQYARLTIVPSAVRDVCIPLGAYTNVVVCHPSPCLPGLAGIRRRVRTAPPVLLSRRGEVALPGPGSAHDFSCAPSEMLGALANAPLLVELWHCDKYTKDVLLGVASVDLAEVLSARPAFDAQRTVQQQEQTVPFVAPEEGLLPQALASPTAASMGATSSARHVAFLDITLRFERSERPLRSTAVTARSASGAASAPRLATAAVGVSGDARGERRAPGSASVTSGGTSGGTRGGGGDRGGDRGGDEPSAEVLGRLDTWQRREQARFRAALQKKEEARLAALSRAWKVHEAKRANEARSQARAMSEVTRELQHKLAMLVRHEEALQAAADQLALHGAALERQGEHERAELVATATKEQSVLGAELDR